MCGCGGPPAPSRGTQWDALVERRNSLRRVEVGDWIPRPESCHAAGRARFHTQTVPPPSAMPLKRNHWMA